MLRLLASCSWRRGSGRCVAAAAATVVVVAPATMSQRRVSCQHTLRHDVRGYTTLPMTNAADASAASAVRVPHVLFFGGDGVSLVALAALHRRLCSIVRHALQPSSSSDDDDDDVRAREHRDDATTTSASSSSLLSQRVAQCVREHLYVVCPSLPTQATASMADVVQRYRRQFPVARYCVAEQLRVFAVDDAKSMARSALLRDMLATTPSDSSSGGSSDTCTAGTTSSWACAGRPLSAFDVAVVVSFRYFLPQRLLRALPHTINVHPSLLPRYRGASPIFATLQHNDEAGGVSIIQMNATPTATMMDAGDVLWQRAVPIPRDMDIRQYFPLVTRVAARGLCDVVFGSSKGSNNNSNSGSSSNDGDDVSGYCDWPDSFARYWRNAQPQPPVLVRRTQSNNNDNDSNSNSSSTCSDVAEAVSIRHYSEDPYHAPLLRKDAAVLYFDRMTALQAYGVWRAFVGGAYFHPAMHAVLHKEHTPVRQQLLQRIIARRQRQLAPRPRRASHNSGGEDEQPPPPASPLSLSSSLWCRAFAELQEGCAFTQAVHPCSVSDAVAREMASVEHAHTAKATNGGDVAAAAVAAAPITPGAGYFPRADETLGAVRCADGWFYWREAHLKRAARAQPASLLRIGLAMRTGVIYAGLFSPYCPHDAAPAT